MKKSNFSGLLSSLSTGMVNHSPEILTGLGIAGMISATVIAVKSTPKALILLEDEKRRQNRELFEDAKKNGDDSIAKVDKLKPIEVVKSTWKIYLPTVIISGLSTACLICSTSVNLKRNAALAMAYTLSESALREYQSKVVETIGDKKAEEIRTSIVQDKIDNDPVSKHKIIRTGDGDTRCYDTWTGRYFWSDIEKIKQARNDLNEQLLEEDYVCLNDFYYQLHLETVKGGEDFGWHISQGQMKIDFSSHLGSDGLPYLAISYRTIPRSITNI